MTSTLDSFPPPTSDPVTEPVAPPPSPPAPPPVRRHSAGHIVAIVAGALALLPGLGLVTGGTALAVAQAAATDDGYFTFTPDRVTSEGVAVITDDEWLDGDDDGGPWVLDFLDLELRLRADGARDSEEIFVGIAHTDDVEEYLSGAAYSVVEEIDGHAVRYRQEAGDATVAHPDDLDIWAVSASGAGEQELTWDVRGGQWSVVVMNADGSPELAADVEIGARSDAVTPIAVALIVFGVVTVVTAVGLLVIGVRGRRRTA